MKQAVFSLIAAAALTLVTFTAANADSITGTVTVSINSTEPISTSGHSTMYTTEFETELTIAALGLDGYETFAYCVDPYQPISAGTYTFNFKTLEQLNNDNYYLAAWLVQTYAPAQGSGLTQDQEYQSAALQSLVWETLYGSSYAVTGSSAVKSYYDTYSDALSNFTLTDSWKSLLSSNFIVSVSTGWYGKQDLLYQVGTNSEVPEPATMVLFGVGLAGMAGLSRRKLRK